jgi:uncharacterized pyridoxal phosphate-containing UPF0001 family protein
LNQLPRIEIRGLMTVPPWAPDAEKARPHFRRLRELKRQCEEILGAPLPHLSMGMSGDFEVAIEEGATLVRIGTALFGRKAEINQHRRRWNRALKIESASGARRKILLQTAQTDLF